MGKTQHQKELLSGYKERTVTGGVCCVRCTASGRVLLLAAPDPQAQRNRFAFAVATDAPLLPSMAPDWRAHGASAFTFEELEALEKKPVQTDRDFHADLKFLTELWREKLRAEGAVFYV